MVTLITRGLVAGRDVVTAKAAAAGGPAVALAVTTALRVAAAVGALVVTRGLGGRYAAGSGVPEIKCFLAGTYLPGALSGAALVAKAVGLPLALASGLSYGVMGPYASMAVILSSLFGRLTLFPALAGSARAQMMACAAAAAAGIGATFGTPIGATLLTIELAAATFPVHWLPLMLYTVVAGYTVTLWVFDVNGVVYFELDPPPAPPGALLSNVVLQVALGALCGLAGAALVKAIRFTSRAVATVVPPRSTRSAAALVAAFVTAHTAIAWSLGGVMWAPTQRDGLLSLFNTPAVSGEGTTPYIDLPAWMLPPPDAVTGAASPYTSAVTLAVLAVVKWVLTAFSLLLPLPAGSFLPIFQTGAAGGRAVAEALRAAFPGRFPWLDPRVYAVLGAAGLTTGAIQTVSIGMVMVELTGGGVSILSLTVSGVTAYVTAHALTHDLFSDILRRRRLPYVYGPRERTRGCDAEWRDTANLWTAADLVAGTPPTTTAATRWGGCPPPAAACGRVTWPGITVGEVCGHLASGDGGWTTAAVVDAPGGGVLLGAVSRHRLQWEVDEVIAAAVGAPPGVAGDSGGGSDGDGGGGSGDYGATTNLAPPGAKGKGGSADAAAAALANGTTAAAVAGTLLPLLATYDPAVGAAAVNPTPFAVCGETPFWKVAHYFTVLHCAQIFVVDRAGVYVGVLSKARFIDMYYALSNGKGGEEA